MKNADMPAMPVAHEKYWELEASGLTKRELFAKDIYVQFLHGAVLPPGVDVSEQLMQVADRAIECADALLAALEPKP